MVPRVIITGHSDEFGTTPFNISLEEERSQSLAAALSGSGVDASWISTQSQLRAEAPGVRTPQATVRLETTPEAALSRPD